MNIRAEIFGGSQERKSRLLVRKMPKRADASALTDVVIPREETRRTDMRHEDRPPVEQQRFGLNFRERVHDIEVVNLSGGGAMIAAKLRPNIGERVELNIADGDLIECVVRWVKDGRIGLEFEHGTKLKCADDVKEAVLRDTVRKLPDEIEIVPVAADAAEHRKAERHPLIWSGELRHGSHRCPVRLRNISATGALVQCTRALRIGSDVILDLGDAGELWVTISWVVGDHAGLRFAEPFDLEQLSRCNPRVTAPSWLRPAYLESDASADSAWEGPWNRMTVNELRTQLDGILKR